MPVLPLVGSSRIVSGVILPARSASSISDLAIRSLTLPVGLWPSSLANRRTPGFGLKRCNSTSGVWPIASTMLANLIWSRTYKFPLSRARERGLGGEGPSSAASDGRQDRHRVARFERRLQPSEVADVLVVDVHVDESPELPGGRIEQTGPDARIAAIEIGEELADRASVTLHHLLALG